MADAATGLPWGSAIDEGWRAALDPGRRDGRLVAESAEREHEAIEVPIPSSVEAGLAAALEGAGIGSLYAHQLATLRAAESANVIVTSGTASGKSLAFNLPVLDAIARDRHARALYLYPTKALAQDQARKLAELAPPGLRQAIYDGDTPKEERRAVRRRSNLILTNPDMLHVGILPHHKSWGDFLVNLRYVVVDEAHVYRGVFGSHVANVLRRLRRACRDLSGPGTSPASSSRRRRSPTRPSWPSACSALPFELIDDDAAPRAGRRIAIWNPPLTDEAAGVRRSAADRGSRDARRAGDHAACGRSAFCDSRKGIELIQKLHRRCASPSAGTRISPSGSPPTAPATRPSSGARSRRASPLVTCSAVVATDALELGIDIGELDAAICVDLPRHGRQPAADVGAGRAPQRGPGGLRRRRGRARPVLLPPSDGVPRPPGRGGDPRPSQRADPVLAPAARPPTRRRSVGPDDDETLGPGWRERAEGLVEHGSTAQGLGRPLRGSRPRFSGGAGRAPLSLGRLGHRASIATPASCSARSRPSAPSRPSTPAPSTCTWVAPIEVARARRRGSGAPSSARSTATTTPRPRKETDIYIERMRGRVATVRASSCTSGPSPSPSRCRLPAQAAWRPRADRLRRARAARAELPHPGALVRAPGELAGPEVLPGDVLLGALHASEHAPDRGAAAARDVRPLGHRRPLDQRPLPDRQADDLHLRRPPRRGRDHPPRLRASSSAWSPTPLALVGECPLRVRAAPPACRARSAATSTTTCTRAARSS